MIVKYGTNARPNNECNVSIQRRTWRDGSNRFRGYIETWTINGRIFASGADLVADLTTKIDALEAEYASDGLDLVLYENDGSTETAHKMDSSTSAGGTRVVSGPSFPSGRGAEYATYRDYTLVVEANFQTAAATLVEFEETISAVGTGGERFVLHNPVTGTPIKQVVAERTPVSLVQDGRAVGRLGYPTVPGPVSASDEHEDRRRISRRSPKRLTDGTYIDFEITWHYEFGKVSDFSTADKTPSVWG